LHNGQVQLSVPGTVRAGSYFQFVTDGDPLGQQRTLSGGQDYDAYIDNLEFYIDRPLSSLSVDPALASESDTGISGTDHVINHLSPTFEWPAAEAGANYQWREGELLEDGTIAYGPWSQPRPETSTTVNLPHGSVHVFSVRPIGADGIVGQESARGIVVDTIAPTIVDIAVRGSNWVEAVPSHSLLTAAPAPLPWMGLDEISVRFSEDVGADIAGLALRGVTTEEYVVNAFTYDPSTFTGTWTLDGEIAIDKLLVDVSGAESSVRDIGGNLVDLVAAFYRFDVLPGDVDGNGGVNFGDHLQTRALVGKVAGMPGYDVRFDVDGNGGINFGDALLTRAAIGSVLPTEEPSLVAAVEEKGIGVDIVVAPIAGGAVEVTATGGTSTPVGESVGEPQPARPTLELSPVGAESSLEISTAVAGAPVEVDEATRVNVEVTTLPGAYLTTPVVEALEPKEPRSIQDTADASRESASDQQLRRLAILEKVVASTDPSHSQAVDIVLSNLPLMDVPRRRASPSIAALVLRAKDAVMAALAARESVSTPAKSLDGFGTRRVAMSSETAHRIVAAVPAAYTGVSDSDPKWRSAVDEVHRLEEATEDELRRDAVAHLDLRLLKRPVLQQTHVFRRGH
jgi:hypothetical protein